MTENKKMEYQDMLYDLKIEFCQQNHLNCLRCPMAIIEAGLFQGCSIMLVEERLADVKPEIVEPKVIELPLKEGEIVAGYATEGKVLTAEQINAVATGPELTNEIIEKAMEKVNAEKVEEKAEEHKPVKKTTKKKA